MEEESLLDTIQAEINTISMDYLLVPAIADLGDPSNLLDLRISNELGNILEPGEDSNTTGTLDDALLGVFGMSMSFWTPRTLDPNEPDFYIQNFFDMDFAGLNFSDQALDWRDTIPDWLRNIFPDSWRDWWENGDRLPDANGQHYWEPKPNGKWELYDQHGNKLGDYIETTQSQSTRKVSFHQNGSVSVSTPFGGGSTPGSSSGSEVYLRPGG